MSEVLIMIRLGEKSCPYIVQLIRAWQEDQYFYMQINLAERGTVKDLLMDLATRGAGDFPPPPYTPIPYLPSEISFLAAISASHKCFS